MKTIEKIFTIPIEEYKRITFQEEFQETIKNHLKREIGLEILNWAVGNFVRCQNSLITIHKYAFNIHNNGMDIIFSMSVLASDVPEVV